MYRAYGRRAPNVVIHGFFLPATAMVSGLASRDLTAINFGLQAALAATAIVPKKVWENNAVYLPSVGGLIMAPFYLLPGNINTTAWAWGGFFGFGMAHLIHIQYHKQK